MGLMGWRDLLDAPSQGVFPWLGGRRLFGVGKAWKIIGRLPREFGWYTFELRGRLAEMKGPAEPDMSFAEGRVTATGYLIGNRFINDQARVEVDPDKFITQTRIIYLAPTGIDRFALVRAAVDESWERRLIFTEQLFSRPADDAVRWAFVERKETVDDIPDVPPALDLAFRFATLQRRLLEERREALRKKREEEEQQERLRKNLGTAEGRRTLAAQDLELALRATLSAGGAEYLDFRDGYGRNEIVVQYRYANQRFECVCNRKTFQIVDSGICLTDHRTGEKGDAYFTLESLPTVIQEAIDSGKLVVYRHVGDDARDDDWED